MLTERESVRLSQDAKGSSGSKRRAGRHAKRYADGEESPVRAARRESAEKNRKVKAEEERGRRARREGPVRRILNRWWDRLLGAASERSFASQEEEYAAHRTTRDYLWNSVGFGLWGMVFPILTMVVTQLVGVELAGMFSLAFVAAQMLYFLGIYGVRTYQVSDLDGEHSFSDYQVQRLLTVVIMLVGGYAYCWVRGFTGEMATMLFGVVAYKAIDALGEVYEGRMQQVDKLYLGGISLSLRSVLAFAVFTVLLFITRDMGVASVGMAIAAAATLILVTVPLAYFESPKSDPFSLASVGRIFKACFPLFVALFLFNLIDNLPKFMMDGVLSYDNQLYFNALYFPSQAVLIFAGFVYKPLLVRMANAWADVSRRRKFDLFIIAMMAIIVVMTVLGIIVMGWIGLPIMGFLYGIDFSQMATLSYIMLAAGGVTAGIDFLYQVITILRRQKVVSELYLITTVFALVVLYAMIHMQELDGAVIGYLMTMVVLFVLLLREYIVARVTFARHPEAEPAPAPEEPEVQRSYVVMYDEPANAAQGARQPDAGQSAAQQAARTQHPAGVHAATGRVQEAFRRGRAAVAGDDESTGKIAHTAAEEREERLRQRAEARAAEAARTRAEEESARVRAAERPRAYTPAEKERMRDEAERAGSRPEMSVAERQRVIDEMNEEKRELARRRLENRRRGGGSR